MPAGADLACASTSSSSTATSLRARYAMPGTDVAYNTTRSIDGVLEGASPTGTSGSAGKSIGKTPVCGTAGAELVACWV
eukprot:703985-Rhodomonas_salina.1